MKLSVTEHKQNAPDQIAVMVITISDTRDEETDKSGKIIMSDLKEHGHTLTHYHIVKDDAELIQEYVRKGADDPSTEAIILNGGTGIAKRDVTVEAVSELLHKEIPGFGEIFRMLSYTEDIGSAAIMSRAIAGVYKDTAVFSIPGSSGAVKLAMNKLILPEIKHVVREIKKD